MGIPYISVVVPTYNRKKVLAKCLAALVEQDFDKSKYEIILIDDGSTDGTDKLIKEVADKALCEVLYLRNDHMGSASARNRGIRSSKGQFILFIDDDIIANPNLIKEHYDWHVRLKKKENAVLGYVTWSSEIKITPFMRWLENGGPQFHFWQIMDKVDIENPRYFYSANLSLSREFLLENEGFFSEDFPYAACEDTELSYRLYKRGMEIKFNKDAVGYHYNPTNLVKYSRKMVYTGISLSILAEKLPEQFSAEVPKFSSIKKIVNVFYPVLTWVTSFIDHYLNIELKPLYGRITDYYKYKGILIRSRRLKK